MGYLDAHIAHRLASGFRVFGADARGRSVFGECLEGLIPETEVERIFGVLFPESSVTAPAREPRLGVRTSYQGLMDARIGAGGDGDHLPAHFPAVIIDLVDESVTHALGGKDRRTRYDQIVEVMVIAPSKAEVRAIHVLIQELLIDSIDYFKTLGYPGGVHCTGSGDIRPVDAAMAGLMPNMLGMFQRYQRYKATIVRTTPRIFTEEPIFATDVAVNHVDSIDRLGEGGKVRPS